MLAFGTQLVEEVYLEQWKMEKELKGQFGESSATWTDRLTKVFDGCISKPWDLRKCYFGDTNRFYMNGPLGQPYFFTVEYLSYDETEPIYGEWDMWKYVSNLMTYTPEIQSAGSFKTSFNLMPVTRYQCEIIRYYDPVANEFSITINGVDMLPVMEKEVTTKGETRTLISGFPLTAISPSGAIPFSKFDNEPMHNFAYSKSVPAKMRIISDVEDMTVKLMILGMKQMRRPPKGNKAYRTFSSELFLPGHIENDVREGELFDILPNQVGIQPAEFSFYEAMKKGRDEITTTRGFSGGGSSSDTATQAIQDKEQQMDKVALMLDGIMDGMRQLYWLRCWNIFENWTKPIDQNIDKDRGAIESIYRSVSMEKQIDGKNKAVKHIKFSDKPVPGKTPLEKSQNIHQQEIDAGKKSGNEVRITIINPQILRSMKLNWFWMVTPSPRNNDSMGQMMLSKSIQDAQTFFGPQSLNVAKLKRLYAMKYNVPFESFFLDEDQIQQPPDQQQPGQPPQPSPMPPSGKMQNPSMGKIAQGKTPQMSAVVK